MNGQDLENLEYPKNSNALFGWGGFGLMDLDLRVQIQILCLDDLKPLGFGFGPIWVKSIQDFKGPNPWISNEFLG